MDTFTLRLPRWLADTSRRPRWLRGPKGAFGRIGTSPRYSTRTESLSALLVSFSAALLHIAALDRGFSRLGRRSWGTPAP